jgi:L-amino acid N-acyltransferase YncA
MEGNMGISYEPVSEGLIPVLREIYNGYVRTSTATFHYEPRTDAEMAEMLISCDTEYLSESWAILWDDEIAGYVYFAPYKKREAYKCSSEVTLYLKDEFTGKGIGTQALKMMEERAGSAGVHTLLAVICGENAASIRLFEKCGYEKCAHLRDVGRKFGRLLDVVMYQKIFP